MRKKITNKQNKTILNRLKAFFKIKDIIILIIGIFIGANNFFENMIALPDSYKRFRNIYIYDDSFLAGNWSNDTEYLLGSAGMNLWESQETLAMSLNVNEDGSIIGSILSKNICYANPITWIIIIESEPHSLLNLIKSRRFFIKRLHDNRFEKIAELKLISEDKKFGTIKFERVNDITGSIPKYIHLAKDLPKFQENWNELESNCVEATALFYKKLFKIIKDSKKESLNSDT